MTEQPIRDAAVAFLTIADLCDELRDNLEDSRRERADALAEFIRVAKLDPAIRGDGPIVRGIARTVKRVAEEAYRTGLEHGRADAPSKITTSPCGIKYLNGIEEFACNLPTGHAGGHSFPLGSD